MGILDLLRAGFQMRRGQTMAEYVLIVSAVAVVVFAGYRLLGTDLTALLNTVDGTL
jgi:Flp pilus assembly pilin Flp